MKKLKIWSVEQIVWSANHKKGLSIRLLVEAESCAEAATLAGDNDDTHEIQRITNLGTVVARAGKESGKETK